jgi:hypothetical protein
MKIYIFIYRQIRLKMFKSKKLQQITEENIILEYKDGFYIDNDGNKYLLINDELILQTEINVKE